MQVQPVADFQVGINYDLALARFQRLEPGQTDGDHMLAEVAVRRVAAGAAEVEALGRFAQHDLIALTAFYPRLGAVGADLQGADQTFPEVVEAALGGNRAGAAE
ncbi:hypothetical protein D3C80_1897930 [compost metagenome]